MNRSTALTSTLLTAWALVACGGGGSDTAPAADPAASTPVGSPSPAPEPAAPAPVDPSASAPTPASPAPPAPAPEPPASAPEPAASAPEPPASAPVPPAPTPAPVPVPPPAPVGQDGSYSDKTIFTVADLNSCPKTGPITLDLNTPHTCLTGTFWGAQANPATWALLTGTNSPYACKLNVIPPKANATGYHFDMAIPNTAPSPSHPNGEYIETHISMSPLHVRNQKLAGYTVVQNQYSRAIEANGDDVIRMDYAAKGTNTTPLPFEKTGEVTNAIHLEAHKAAGSTVWRVFYVMHDSYTPAAGLACVSTVYK